MVDLTDDELVAELAPLLGLKRDGYFLADGVIDAACKAAGSA